MKKQKQQVTLESLSGKIDNLGNQLSHQITEQITESFESLARMTKNGFDSMGERFDRLEGRQGVLESRQGALESRQKNLEQGQNRIELQLDYLAPRVEVSDLKRRVTKLEKKVGIA